MTQIIQPSSLAITTIWQEARNEPYIGKVAVGEVIRERMRRRYSSDGSVAGTVGRPYQFSGWKITDPNFLPSLYIDDFDPVVVECIKAWWESILSKYSKGAVLYCNLSTVGVRPNWAKEENVVVKIGGHTFFSD